MRAFFLVGAPVVLWACGAPAPAAEPTAQSSSAIQDGTTDTTHSFAVGVVQLQGQNAAFCSGALLAPNLVATARHCVAQIATTQIDCTSSTFGSVVSPSQMDVTADAVISGSSVFVGVTSILVPSAPGQDKVCGNDIALLILDRSIQLPRYVVPVLSPPMTDQSLYSTTVTAIGYGVDTPTDMGGTTAGTRRIKENISLRCIPNDATFTDCFSDPTARGIMTASEFISGDASTCEGDSGSSAYEQTNFAKGNWVSFGVLSRGGVSADGQTCIQPIYSRFDAWAALLLEAANQAAAAGGYNAPSWATAGAATSSSGTDSGSGRADGAGCAANGECLSNNCVSRDGQTFVCASTCGPSACAPGFQCVSGYCFPSPAEPTAKSGGCATVQGPAPGGPLSRTLAGGLFLFALGAWRRRRSP
jgi:V8-like Glu-specific endopeptidase